MEERFCNVKKEYTEFNDSDVLDLRGDDEDVVSSNWSVSFRVFLHRRPRSEDYVRS